MKVVAITGASGFIGKALSRTLREAGHRVIGLSRVGHGDVLEWRLGEPLPPEAAAADAVIHLASATLVEKVDLDEACKRDIDGTRVLVEQVRTLRDQGRRIRFVFLSSQSARSDAINRYGWSKWQIEQLLTGPDEVVVRPGLVFDDAGSSVFGLLRKLSYLPLVPDVGDLPSVQPIHVDDLGLSLERIVTKDASLKIFCLGAITPMTLIETIKAIARGDGRRPAFAVRAPSGLVSFGARMFDMVFRPVPSLSERVNGLIGLKSMDTAASLQVLGLRLRALGRENQSMNE